MPLCAAIGCNNKSYRKTKEQVNTEKNVEITFHRFPKDEVKKSAWLKAMGLQEKTVSKCPHLCSLHFMDNDFDRSSPLRTRLKENAIPITNQSAVKSSENETEMQHVPSTTVQNNCNNDLTISKTSQDETENVESLMDISLSKSVFDNKVTLELETTNVLTHHGEEINSDSDNETILKAKRHCSTMDNVHANQRLDDTPRKKLLRKVILNQKKYYERQVRSLKQKFKRQEKRVAKLHTIIKELKTKCLVSDEHADILQSIETYLINCVLIKFTESNNLFLNLKQHSHDQNPLENHIIHLTKAIACKYIKIRLYHIGKEAMENIQSERHYRNKLTLFQGQ